MWKVALNYTTLRNNISYTIVCILITLFFIRCSDSPHADVEIGEVRIYQSNIIAAFKKKFDTVKPERKQFDEWLLFYFDRLRFADEAIRKEFHLSRLFKHAYMWKFIHDVGKNGGYFDYLYIRNKRYFDSGSYQNLVSKELDKQIDGLGKDSIVNIFRTSKNIPPHYLPRQDGYHYFILGENYFISYIDIANYHKYVNFYSMTNDTVRNFKNLISYHFKYVFYTNHVVKDDHLSILIQNNYLDHLSDCYVAALREGIRINEHNLLNFYNENANKFNCYTKLELKVLHFNTVHDYFRYKENKKSDFTERTVWLAIEDSLSNNFGIPDYARKKLFYEQEDEIYFINRGQHCLGFVVGKYNYKKLSFNQAKKIIPDAMIISDVFSKRFSQLKGMYKLNKNISLDTLYFQCLNAISVN
jgi:hypothetical protein